MKYYKCPDCGYIMAKEEFDYILLVYCPRCHKIPIMDFDLFSNDDDEE